VPDDTPTLAALQRTAAVFNGYTGVDDTWLRLLEAAAPGLDLARADHRALLLRWLNSWGCRIRYPREGEPAPFDVGAAQWGGRWGSALPSASLARLSDRDIDAVGAAYAALAALEVSVGRSRRTLGPTAAAKALYALRPAAVMPWDAAIAQHLYGVRDGAAFAEHQRLGRRWASAVVAESGAEEDAVPGLVGRPTVSLAKILDEYLYVTITRSDHAGPPREG
jgi:hypothetical protein